MNLCIWPIILVTIVVALIPYVKLFRIEGENKTKPASSKIEMKPLDFWSAVLMR